MKETFNQIKKSDDIKGHLKVDKLMSDLKSSEGRETGDVTSVLLIIAYAIAGTTNLTQSEWECVKYYSDVEKQEFDRTVKMITEGIEDSFFINYPNVIKYAIGQLNDKGIYYAMYAVSFATVDDSLSNEKWCKLVRIFKALGPNQTGIIIDKWAERGLL